MREKKYHTYAVSGGGELAYRRRFSKRYTHNRAGVRLSWLFCGKTLLRSVQA